MRKIFLVPSAPKEELFTHYYLAINIERIISTIKINRKVSERDRCTLNPINVVKSVNILMKEIDRLLLYDHDERKGLINLFRSHIIVSLASKEVCVRHRLTTSAFDELIKEITYKLKKSMVHPGEAVGAIAA